MEGCSVLQSKCSVLASSFVCSRVLVEELNDGGNSHLASGTRKRRRRVIKSQGGEVSLVMGDDIQVE
jgi:hypothetical protein